MIQCPSCKKGKQTITVTDYGSKKMTTVEIDCVECKGKGLITSAQAALIEQRENMWCTCTETYDVTYHEDGNDICGKHCYTCNNCNKIVQIG